VVGPNQRVMQVYILTFVYAAEPQHLAGREKEEMGDITHLHSQPLDFPPSHPRTQTGNPLSPQHHFGAVCIVHDGGGKGEPQNALPVTQGSCWVSSMVGKRKQRK
jgi:hypothetical protein